MTVWEFIRAEFSYMLRAYFLPVCAIWLLVTRGPRAAGAHVKRVWDEIPPCVGHP